MSDECWVPLLRSFKQFWNEIPFGNLDRLNAISLIEQGTIKTRAAVYADGRVQTEFRLSREFWVDRPWRTNTLSFRRRGFGFDLHLSEEALAELAKLLKYPAGNIQIEIEDRSLKDAATSGFGLRPQQQETERYRPRHPKLEGPAATTDRRYITSAEVMRRCAISRMTLHRRLLDPSFKFPKPMLIGKRRYWFEDEISAWQAAQRP